MSTNVRIRGGDDLVREIRLERGADGAERATIRDADGAEHVVTFARAGTAPHGGWLRLGDGGTERLVPWRALRDDETLHLWIDGRTHRLEIVPRTARRSRHADADAARDELVAPMPGTILRIAVAPGDAFAADQPLIVMESMKMEMTIAMPKAGVVGEILCAVGELVAIDQVLLRRRPDES